MERLTPVFILLAGLFFLAAILTGTYAESAMAGQPVSLHYQFFVVGETPVPGSNLCPNSDGTLLIPCGPEQTPP